MKIWASVLLLFASCYNTDQTNNYFEGKIIYKNSAQSKNPNFSGEDLLKLSGDSSIFYFKQGNYRQLYDAKNLKEEIYDQSNSTVFTRENNSDTFFKHKVSIPATKIEEYTLNKKREKILGIMCDELIVHYKNKTITYYFNPDSLKIDPKWYENYTDLNKNFTSQQMKSLFLKCKMEYPEAIFELTATSITHEKVNDFLLKVPEKTVVIERQAN